MSASPSARLTERPPQGQTASALPLCTLIRNSNALASPPACLPAWGGYICNSTNITQATNEFLKSTIKGEAAPAAHIALALASLLTQAIFQAVVLLSPKYFPLKVAFHQHRALGAGIWRTTTEEGERWQNSHLQLHVCASTKYIPVFTPPATN